MYCKNCGGKIDDGEMFCGICGNSVMENKPAEKTSPASSYAFQTAEEFSRIDQPQKKVPVTALILGILSLGLPVISLQSIFIFIVPFAGLVLGIIGLCKAVKFLKIYPDAGKLKVGKGLSIAGIVVNGLLVALIIALIVLLIVYGNQIDLDQFEHIQI